MGDTSGDRMEERHVDARRTDTLLHDASLRRHARTSTAAARLKRAETD